MTPDDLETFTAAARDRAEVRITLGTSTIVYGRPVAVEGSSCTFVERGTYGAHRAARYGLANVSDVRRLPMGGAR